MPEFRQISIDRANRPMEAISSMEAAMRQYPNSAAILERNRRHIPGGVVSVNRSVSPQIVFTRAQGALMWDADGNKGAKLHEMISKACFERKIPHRS